MSVFSLPVDFDLSEHFDHATLMRAIGLQPEQALLSLHEEPGTLHTRLRGSATGVYEQTISFFVDPRTGLHLRGLCTCPVGFNCKHTAAALMAYEAGLARARRAGASGLELLPTTDRSGAHFAATVELPTARANFVKPSANGLVRENGFGASAVDGAESVGGPTLLPYALESWLGSADVAFDNGTPIDNRGPAGGPRMQSPTKRLMYMLRASQSRLLLTLHMGSPRRNGEITQHRAHGPSVSDMLRTRPAYLTAADESLLAALLPLTLQPGSVAAPAPVSLHGRGAAAVLQQMVQANTCWLVGPEPAPPDAAPGSALRWVPDALPLRLRWHADAAGRWLTRWEMIATDTEPNAVFDGLADGLSNGLSNALADESAHGLANGAAHGSSAPEGGDLLVIATPVAALAIDPALPTEPAAESQTQPSPQAVISRPATAVPAPVLVLLPEPHVFVPDEAGLPTVRPADVSSSGLTLATIRWLAGMPAVPNAALPALVARLRTLALAHQVVLPLPDQHAQPLQELGQLTLQPVLRLLTCPNVPSETWLEGHQRPPPAGQPLRQAAAQLVLRYQLAGQGSQAKTATVDFNFPAGASDVAFIEQPDQARPGRTQLTRFKRHAQAEAEAMRMLFEQVELRPWSRVAAFALDRMASLKAGRLQAAALPPALEDGLLMLVPNARELWPLILSRHVPALQAAGWRIERADDFPFEVFEADDFELNLDEATEGGTDWFRIGLKVNVGGVQVDLVPLLIGLVQAGWLKLEASLRDPTGEVLLPWPDDTPPAAGAGAGPGAPRHARTLRRERLLRLPVARVAPLVAWLRGVFNTSGFTAGEPRVSRFELGAIENLSGGLAMRVPPAVDQLIAQLRSLRLGEGLPAVAVSPHVNAQLRPYQLDGLAWMDFLRRAGFGGVLADDMGLGKTLQTLALLQAELDAGRLDRPSLVVVPTSLLENWQAEASRFTPQLRMLVLHGKLRAQQFKNIAAAHVVVTSYPLAVRDMDVLAGHGWHYLVLDEAQRIKNSRSQATLALKALNARHRLCLSGTPLENHLGELWSLMDFVSPGLLGSELQFREHYRNPIEKRQEMQHAEQLARRVRPFILRRTKLQVAQDLPEKTETLLRVELDGTQRDLYETVRATMDSKLREAIAKQGLARSQIVVLDALLKLRQVCCDPRLLKSKAVPLERDGFASTDEKTSPQRHTSASVAPSAKLDLLRDLLPTLVEDGRRILVFSQFTEMLALIEPELVHLKLDYLKLTGDTVNRGAMVQAFQEGTVPIFLISLKAGGVGLNLTAADTVILYDPWWNPAVEQQAIDRAYRIGQGRPVFVYKLVASGTVEEKMLELQARKAGLADSLLSGVAGTAALTAQDFDELFKPLGAG